VRFSLHFGKGFIVIIGLTGRNGAGKGEVAKFLEEAGFHYHSLSDIIREEIRRKRLPVTRERLIVTGTRLREREGLGVLAERTLKKLSPDQNYVVDSIRNPEEVKVLRRRDDFFLLNVMAPRAVRFRRVRARKRESDPSTLSDFVRLEEKEFRGSNPAGQQLLATERLADAKIPNASSLDRLRDSVRTVVLKLAKSHPRPSWDAYFMGIARVVSLRSNCVKRRWRP
jgi:dCMP deaminase